MSSALDEKEDLGAAPAAPAADVRLPIDIKKAEWTVFELHRRW